ncbi:hypothetical protein EKO27_g10247 [Xylaria grammica]|uniref:FAD/NAD(P)-binding domain-containing protein n=1 Tax=Xylaria grammica TaxID=363999 RepID=A0A439CRQ2_9PEZI|nr:hypothetical protein EKO27_g10247 [Xylaria grammica]
MSIIIPDKDGVEALNAEAPANGDNTALKVDATEANGVKSTSMPGFKLEERTVDDVRPLRVAVVGAGIGGINTGILFPEKMPRIRLTIFDKNPDVGVLAQRCEKYNVYQYIKFGHRVTGLEWDSDAAEWIVKLHTVEGDKQETFDFAVLSIGQFSGSKTIAVIGNGAGGIQLVSNLQRIATCIKHYAHNRTWIACSWSNDVRTLEPQYFSAEHLNGLEDPDAYLEYRKREEDKNWRGVGGIIPGAKENEEVRNLSLKILKQRLVNKPELLDKLVPNFSPQCRRLASGPGYLEALDADNVDYIQFHICHGSHCWLNPVLTYVIAQGGKFSSCQRQLSILCIEAMDGVHRQVDAIFCATGFNNKLTLPFLIVANGADLRSAWSPGVKWGIPTWEGLQQRGNGDFQLFMRDRDNLPRPTPTQGLVSGNQDYPAVGRGSGGLPRPGGFIHSFWPGGGAHLATARASPRWEDWEYKYHSKSDNRYAYFGPGWTKKELDPEADLASYLKQLAEVDLRSLHEEGWHRL